MVESFIYVQAEGELLQADVSLTKEFLGFRGDTGRLFQGAPFKDKE